MSTADNPIGAGVLARPGLATGSGTAGARIGRHRSPWRAVLTWHRMLYRARHRR